MVAHITTFAFHGVDVLPIDVQVQISGGLPAFTIVGLPDKAVAESKERVRSALNALSLSLPPKRITINLAPADVQKEGSHYDLPIALGLLSAMEVIPSQEMDEYAALGELALDGALMPIAGVLPAAIHANALGKGLICPAETGAEASWAGDMKILAPGNLISIINHMKGTQILTSPKVPLAHHEEQESQGLKTIDMSDVRGQESVKRALEITAAGGHNMLMVGPPGSGKSMLAARLNTILPPLTPQDALETSMVHSIAGQMKNGTLVKRPPYRDPHHSASLPALVGGGQKAHPGEISLAHNGVLFLDELPEFSRATLEALRQPLETGEALISRANHHVRYPARFQLVAAMNPCKCGYLGDAGRMCSKAPRCAVDYQNKISGPLFDRIDIHVDVPAVSASDLSLPKSKETSADILKRVMIARDIQRRRYQDTHIKINAHAGPELLDELIDINDGARSLLIDAIDRMKLSARSYHRLMRVSRTIADLEGMAEIEKHHVAEALGFRKMQIQS